MPAKRSTLEGAPAKARRNVRAGADTRRPQILKKAAQLFRSRGYHATSMDEVAAALNLNKATIYHHFPGGKSDLLYGIITDALDDLFARVERRDPNESPLERLRGMIADQVTTEVERPDAVRVHEQESRLLKDILPPAKYREIRARETQYRDLVRETIEAGNAEGVFEVDNPAFAATAIVASVAAAHPAFRLLPPTANGGESAAATAIADLVLCGAMRRDAPTPAKRRR